ncbi:hypothetical protein [uncultured Hymenobacter sp.]|uniref:hypothetical protein n=1 Tax=uncultured Hymenobacter sp. TaxID=170016 RepID=UPI0035CB1D34
MKQFLPAIVKITVIIIALFISIILILIGYEKWESYKYEVAQQEKTESDNKLAANYSSIKYWPSKGPFLSIGMSKIRFKSKFRNGKLYYALLFEAGKNRKAKQPTSFEIYLVDKDGFKVSNTQIPSTSMIRTVDDNGNFAGYEFDSTVDIDINDYASVADWNISWGDY